MADPVIDVQGLTVEFGSFRAVDDVSFHVDPGETLAIVGESGSGKSVTALSIMRLVELSSRGIIAGGSVHYRAPRAEAAVDLFSLSEREMRDIRGNEISMIFQEPLTSLNPVYTVGNQVAEAVRLHQEVDRREAKQRALDMFNLVRIPDAEKRLDQYPHEMSGGMRQRVMIAMALACDPTVLIADEPTTALDVTIQAQILALMRELQSETGAAVVMITHDMGVVAEVADRVVVMSQAKIVEQGPVEQIFEDPQEDYTKSLLAAVPRLGSMAGTDGPERFNILAQDST
jgi:glutathione transport system ATP-binding protein